MKLGLRHLTATGLTTVVLFALAQTLTDAVMSLLFPQEVTTLSLALYHLLALGFSATFTIAVPLQAIRSIEQMAQLQTRWLWALPFAVPPAIGACLYLEASVWGSSLLCCFLIVPAHLALLASLVCTIYTIFYWLVRLATPTPDRT